eukprot:TRINITY_DN6360_c0_g2_i1.p1 TRINITY_DN6360_c0_g2~~TRINITY_DN6360_c0_g2_i1.p1  ORF type:complete len:239 (+),score=52.58 TRINITY_DN6360_c0_g2_i1:194-910(+)
MFLILVVLLSVLSTTSATAGIHQVQHSFHSHNGAPVFEPCCTLEQTENKPGLVISERAISGAELEKLVALAESGGFYRLRVPSGKEGVHTMAFAPACALLASNLKEEWYVTMDQFDNVVALDVSPRKTDCSRLDLNKWRGGEHVIATTAKLVYPWRGIRPEVKLSSKPGAAQSSKAPSGQSDGDARQQGSESDEPQEPPSFLRRYWLYIAIPVIWMLMGSLPQEEGKPVGKKASAAKK